LRYPSCGGGVGGGGGGGDVIRARDLSAPFSD